jgi:hypothetical protein
MPSRCKMSRVGLLIVSLVTGAAGCDHGRMAVATASELRALDLAARVGTYVAQDAVWISGQPLAVNRDFDFAIAAALDIEGAGIAAAQRRSANVALTRTLERLAAIDPHRLLQARCTVQPASCAGLHGHEIRLYGVLFGARSARLRTILEIADATPSARVYVSVSDAMAVSEFEKPDVLRSIFEREIDRVLGLLKVTHAPTAAEAQCPSGDSTSITGQLVARDGLRVMLLASDPQPMLVTCHSDGTTASNHSTTP